MEEIEMVAIAAPDLILPVAKRRLDLARMGDLTFIMSEPAVS